MQIPNRPKKVNPKKNTNNPVGVRLDPTLREEITKVGKQIGVSRSSLMRAAMLKGWPSVKKAFERP